MQFTDEWLVPTLETLVPEDALKALRGTEGAPASVWEAVVQRKLATDAQILGAIASRFRLPVADFSGLDPRVKDEIPEQLVRKFNVLPLKVTDAYLEVATANPFDLDAEKTLAFATGREVRMALGSPARIREKLDDLYRNDDVVSRLLEGIGGDFDVKEVADEDDAAASAEQASQRPIVRLVDMMLADAATSRASDIHVEPAEGGVVIRYRIDGVLRQVMRIPRTAGIPLISRVKIMSGLDIADRLRPQDGRARITVNNEPIDLRVSTLPASMGEKVVIRLLSSKGTILALDGLGLFEDEADQIRRLLHFKEGILLVTGPTGSGKTTTLYSAIRVIQGEGVNIVTVEDPVEYRLGANIVQVQVHEKANVTFASALRSILRQDPDVVLIGEIRDQETAQIAVQASLTGHLVFSTLHTNDAPGALTRLVDMGVEPYLVASSLEAVLAQRLVRLLCKHCRVPDDSPAALAFKTQVGIPANSVIYRSVGCRECRHTGFHGRHAIFEWMDTNNEIRELILKNASSDLLRDAAQRYGMRTLAEDGWRLVRLGITTVEEVLSVTTAKEVARTTKESSETAAKQAAPSPRH